jgi:hypothetical protein
MMNESKPRRFGVHEVKKGKFKGHLHVSTEAYQLFFGELAYLSDYLKRRLAPLEPEEGYMREILLDLENILEFELEYAIKRHAKIKPSKRTAAFVNNIDEGFVSFKSKFEWARKRSIISADERDVMEEIRRLRNAFAHITPTPSRKRHKYFNKPLMTTESLRRMFLQVELVLRTLRKFSRRKAKWDTTPPGYCEEMGWPSLEQNE